MFLLLVGIAKSCLAKLLGCVCFLDLGHLSWGRRSTLGVVIYPTAMYPTKSAPSSNRFQARVWRATEGSRSRRTSLVSILSGRLAHRLGGQRQVVLRPWAASPFPTAQIPKVACAHRFPRPLRAPAQPASTPSFNEWGQLGGAFATTLSDQSGARAADCFFFAGSGVTEHTPHHRGLPSKYASEFGHDFGGAVAKFGWREQPSSDPAPPTDSLDH